MVSLRPKAEGDHVTPLDKGKPASTRRALHVLILVCLGLSLTGCAQVASIFAYAISPTETIKAQYRIPAGKKVLVFPDDRACQVDYPPVKRALADKLNAILAEQKLVAATVPYEQLREYLQTQPKVLGVRADELSIGRIGKDLGADMVIYLNINTYSLKETPGDVLWIGKFGCLVKVVEITPDVKQSRWVWPDLIGKEVKVELPPAENASEMYGEVICREMANQLAAKVSLLFHDYKVDRMRMPEPTPE
jgi:hypothetical protein